MWRGLIVLLYFCQSGCALYCFSCDSNFDASCAVPMRNTSGIYCDEDDTECSTWVVDSSIYRGCASQMSDNVTDFMSCADGDFCNNDLYPKDRLTCVTCSADNPDCIAPGADLNQPCRSYVLNDKCYAYIINETAVIRGCMSDDNENVAKCQSAGELCTQCGEDLCNFQSGFSNIQCVACSSDSNHACAYSMHIDPQYSRHICTALVNRSNFCVSFRNGSTYHRGCLSDYQGLSVESCMANDDCETCDDNFCNVQQMVNEECYECDSSSGNCETFTDFNQSAVVCKEVTIEKTGCYHYVKNNTIRRGCISSLSHEEYQNCSTDNSCKFCQGSKCNSRETFLKCFACNSQDDLNCVTAKSELQEKTCDSYSDTCKVYVKPNMTTHRGCSSELESGPECPSNSVNCKQCDEPLCNGGIFPSTRLVCHHCQSSTDPNCHNEISDRAISYPCKQYNFRDSCYLFVDANNVTVRGCLSDSDIYTDLCTSNASHCEICNTSNCNGKSVRRPPSLSCIKCDSASDPKCLWGFKEGAAMPCMRDLYFYEEESCFTFHVSATTVIRQCTLDSNVCPNNPRCSMCNTNACNGEQKASLYCHECSSDDNPACLSDLAKVESVSCPGPVTYENRGCFTWKQGGRTNVTRGCLASLLPAKKFHCMNDRDNCEICIEEQNCNSEMFGGAKVRGINGLLIAVSVIIAIVLRDFQ